MAEWVAITGSAGYIGSVLAKHCKDRGYNVLGCDIQYDPHDRKDQKYVDVPLACAYEDPHFATICERYDIKTIFHLGGSASVPLSSKIPFHFYHNNVGNTAKMIDNLLATGWREREGFIVFSSTSSVYQENTTHKDETAPIGSPNPYGRSKYMAEQVIEDAYKLFGIPSIIFRYFCVAGAYGDVGQPTTYPHMIPRIMDAAHTEVPLKLFGNNWPTPDGSSIRDFISVNDICRAHFHAAEYLKSNPGVHRFNMGTRDGISMLDLIKRFEDNIGIDVPYDIADRRVGDPAILLCDPSKFIRDTGFVYEEDLDIMLRSAWDWYCYNKEEV